MAISIIIRLNYTADYSQFWIESKLQASFDAGVPVHASIDGHAVVALGFLPITITYKKTNWLGQTVTKTEEQLYVVISSGWYDSDSYPEYRYAYVDFDDIIIITVPER